MLNADSSALKSESDDQRSTTPPTIPSVAELSCTLWTSERMLLTELPGNARLNSLTRKSDASARCATPSSASAMKVRGTNERSAKYATIAARWGPRSAKNFATRTRLRTRTAGVLHRVRADSPVLASGGGRRPGTRRPDRDLLADRGRRPLRRGRVGPGLDPRLGRGRSGVRALGVGAARERGCVPLGRGQRHPAR